jgi:hypothetical protein
MAPHPPGTSDTPAGTRDTAPAGAAPPFDPDDPPGQAPAGAHVMIWNMAYRIFTEHRPEPDGTCRAGTCRAAANRWPCPPAELARAGFVEACRPITEHGPGGGAADRRAA